MPHFNLFKLTLEISGEIFNRKVSKRYNNGQEIRNFAGDLASNKSKIYIAMHNGNILYVGYTSDTISSRLRNGLKPYKKKSQSAGYHGYKWKFFNQIDYYVFAFNIPPTIDKEIRQMFENIEAEIVFLLKQRNNWPTHQSEIHFYAETENQKPAKAIDVFGISEREMAISILNKL